MGQPVAALPSWCSTYTQEDSEYLRLRQTCTTSRSPSPSTSPTAGGAWAVPLRVAGQPGRALPEASQA